MNGFKEFKARIESDTAFRAKFAEFDSEDKLIAAAKAEGYDLSESNFEQLSENELDEVAGRLRGPSYGGFYKSIKNLIELIKGGNKVY